MRHCILNVTYVVFFSSRILDKQRVNLRRISKLISKTYEMISR